MEGIKSKHTDPADYYSEALEGFNEETLQNYLSRRGLTVKEDMETFLSATNAASHQLRGGDPLEAMKKVSPDPIEASVIKELLQSIDFDQLSGETPIEKGAAFSSVLKSEGGLESAVETAKKGKSLEHIQKSMAQKMDQLGALKDNEFAQEMLNTPQEVETILPTLGYMEKEILKALKDIENITAMSGKRPKKLVAHPSGNIPFERRMKNYEELSILTDFSQVFDADFLPRFANMELTVTDYKKPEYLKKIVVAKIDRSGSMSPYWKQAYVKALLMFYFNLLKKGQVEEIFLTTFEREIDGWERIKNETQAREYYQKYRLLGGGTTEVGEVIKKTQADIASGKIGEFVLLEGCQPEIVVINDGQDDVDRNLETIAPIHVISLEEHNPDLEALATRSGGSFTLFRKDENATF